MGDEVPAGARQIATAVGGNPTGIPGTRGTTAALRGSQRPSSAGFLLQGGARNGTGVQVPAAKTRRPASGARWQTVKPPPRRELSMSYSTEVPPLALALERAGLGHHARKLCNEMSCSTVGQLLALNRPQLDALFDELRPLPGHRARLHQFLADQRMEAMKAAADGTGAADGAARPTAAQQREWAGTRRSLRDASIAARRGRDGPISHLIEQQPLHWGAIKGKAPLAQAYVSRTRVLMVGGSRQTVFDGDAPNSPSRRGQRAGTPAATYDPDVF